jgi:type VI secretion system protein ImpM
MPSVDSAGRHFPLVFALCAPSLPRCPGFLASAENAGRDALELDLGPDAIAARLSASMEAGVLPPMTEAEAIWWTDGSPRCPPQELRTAGLPLPAQFASMLDVRALAPE